MSKKREDPTQTLKDLKAITDAPEVVGPPDDDEAPTPALIVDEPPEDPPPAEAEIPKPEVEVPVPEAPAVPAHLADRAAAIQELSAKLTEELESFKAGQAYIDGDVPIYLESLGGSGIGPTDRRVGWLDPRHLDSRYAFRWANKKMVDYHRAKGRWDIKHKDFELMVKARGGKYSFRSNEEGQVACGDLVLMATTQEQNEALKKRVRVRTERSEGQARGSLRTLGKQLGMEVTGDDDVGPKVRRIMDTISKELGPDALKVFQGQATR